MIFDRRQKKKSSDANSLSVAQDEGDDFSPVKEKRRQNGVTPPPGKGIEPLPKD